MFRSVRGSRDGASEERRDESIPEVTTVIHRRNCQGRHLTFGTHATVPHDAMIKSAAQGKELLQSDIQRGELEGTRRPLLLLLLLVVIAAPLRPGPPPRGRGKDDVL